MDSNDIQGFPVETEGGHSRVILTGGPLDGSITYIGWQKGPGKVAPERVLIPQATSPIDLMDDRTCNTETTRVAIYTLIDNWPLRYLFEGYSNRVKVTVKHQ